MAIRIVNRTSIPMVTTLPQGDILDIVVDAEADVAALGTDEIDDGYLKIKPAPGSMAHTAGYGVIYELSPSGVWTKV